VHGGGFYHAQKYKVAPPLLPETLHWFKWEAYTTWLSGMFLLALMYWYAAEIYTIDPGVAELSKTLAVAIGIALGVYRIITGTPLYWYIITGYVFVLIQTLFAPRLIIALAYDSGGVTTSTVTVPLVAALGLGLAGTVPGRDPLLDGFGLIAFASLFPIMSVLAYAQLSEWKARRSKKTLTE